MVVGGSPEEHRRSKSSLYSINYKDSTAPNTSSSTTFAPREMRLDAIDNQSLMPGSITAKTGSKSHRPNNIADIRNFVRNVCSDLGTKSSSPKDEVKVVQSIV